MRMVLTGGVVSVLFAIALGSPITARPLQSEDPGPNVRRLAAIAGLAAQEYRVGIKDGRITAPEEVQEAKLFLTEARRTAGLLPADAARATAADLDQLLALIEHVASPDSVDASVSRLSTSLASRLGVTLDEIPALTPSLARGAEIYQSTCASCHGTLGLGDGLAATGLNPPPANLTSAAGLADRSPLDFFHRVSIGVVGTAMPAFETRLSAEDRWAVAVYASLLRLPAPRGDVPPSLRAFATSARMSDVALLRALSPDTDPNSADGRAAVAAVRGYQNAPLATDATGPIFLRVRQQLDSALLLATSNQSAAASGTAFDAYMTFEQVERSVRAHNAQLATSLEADFASLRTRAAGGATSAELNSIRAKLGADLENAERVISDQLSPVNLFVQSFIILLREGLEAILVIGALIAFLMKTGASHRIRDIHIGIGAAIGASLLTALALETIFQISPSHQEGLEGITMIVATVMLFYVSYWLLSKMEVAKWNRFVKGKVQDALSSGSALALSSVAFLAVYREGFETVLFYKALFLSGGTGDTVLPVVAGIVAGSLVLVVVYLGINRFGMRIPLKPFFGVTSAFLYYMAFVFAGKGVAELQEGGLVSTTIVQWGPRLPALGVYPTLESLSLQGVLLALFLFGVLWTFVIEPRRLRVTSVLVPDAPPASPIAIPRTEPTGGVAFDIDMLRSLERMDADLAELRSEVDRLKRRLTSLRAPSIPRS